ncbi:MAG: riboflavin synthase [Desulfomonilaceae bacterium]
MFTGIIQDQGKIVGIEPMGEFVRLKFSAAMSLDDVNIGDSICVNGVCLTVTHLEKDRGQFWADASPETLRVSTLGSLRVGSVANLEKALRVGDRLGGHIVSGHIDGVGVIADKRPVGSGFSLAVDAPSGRYLVEKGSVAVDGVSLTVNRVEHNRFWVMIIPHTSIRTGLTEKKIGDRVNIEYDMIAKYIEKFVTNQKVNSGITEDTLREYGFV